MGVNASVSANLPTASLSGGIGIEETFHPYTGENTTFLVVGGSLKFGADFDSFKSFFIDLTDEGLFQITAGPYVGSIRNVENLAEDYSGPFATTSSTYSAGKGITIGESAAPLELDVSPEERKGAYSYTVGLTTGYGFSHNVERSYYIPLRSKTPGSFVRFPFVSNIINSIFS